ncbi:unnamed protein product, partial [Brenthis ino]
MQKLQESVFSIVKTTSLSPAVFSFLQPTEEFSDKTPLGGILRDTKYGWLALGPKFCVVDLRSGLKIAARTFGGGISSRITVTSVVELPTPLTENSQQLIISLECDDTTSLIYVFHINGSQLLRCIQTNVVVTELAVCDALPNGPLMCFDGLVMAGTRRGEVLVFDLNRAILLQALKDVSQGYEHLVRGENNVANLIFLPFKAIHKIESQRDLAVENDDHLAILLNEDSFLDGQYIFRNPDGTVRMKAKQSHIRVTVAQYIPQLGSLAVGFNFGAFQIWNLLNLELEFTSQVNVECLPVTHFGFQEPCDDPRAFCYLWVVFSVIDRFEEEEFPLAVMYSLTYQGKRMLTETKCLYQKFSMATIRFQIELSAMEDAQLIGGRCISCHTYSISSTLGEEGEDTMLNLCQLIWECWGNNPNLPTQHGMLLFDLDQWYKDQMPATYHLENNAFMSVSRCPEVSSGTCLTLDIRLDPTSVSPYSHATRLEEHFYPNSLQYNCTWLNTSEASILHTVGVQRQLVRGIGAAGPSCLLAPARLHAAAVAAGLRPLYCHSHAVNPDEQRRYLLSVALEGRLSRFLKRCAHDWATGTHSGVGCTLPFLVDWSWKRAIELKENAKDLTAPLFTSANVPDRNVVRCLEHCVQQLTQLTGLLDAILTKCCNLVVPDALSEMEEKYKGMGTVSLYFQVVQWFVRVALLPERAPCYAALPYPAAQLADVYTKRRVKLHRLQDRSEEESVNKSCSLLYIDQLIENEFGGERVHQMWIKAGSTAGLYPPPSLYALLRLYLLPDIPEEHKHSLLLYLLLDYSMLYDDIRYEAVIRRLMQFPTMFGLSNTAIKATQAFWHLDHRDFDFALDQLQCLTGNTLSDWQHHVVLSSLLAQKKTQAALQYLHVRKPPPIQSSEVNDHDKLEDWQSCCNLYLARGLVFEALDVIRMCVQNASSADDKTYLLNFFYKGCRNTGQLSKVLQATLLPFEEEVFINYLKDCNEPQTSDILIMYYLQQARYLEAQQHNERAKARGGGGAEGEARDALVEAACAALPRVSHTVARAITDAFEPHIIKPKPMSVYVQAKSPKNTFTYKSSFIQDTIENASETWINKPKLRKGIKRALNIEETPFICTPKTYKTRSFLSEQKSCEATPPKRAKLDLTGTPRTPKVPCTLKVSDALSRQMASLLDMPEVESPHKHYERAETPHSILKNRRLESRNQDAPSPADSRYQGDSDDELETASNHTHCSDANKHLRFTIPTSSEAGSTPSPVAVPVQEVKEESEDSNEHEDYGHRASPMSESHPMESPPKKFAAEEVKLRKSYKDNVRARKSLSISVNSSLSDDPNSSIESIADIPVTLINPRYSARERDRLSRSPSREREEGMVKVEITERENGEVNVEVREREESYVPKTPKGRRSIRSGVSDSASVGNRSHSVTPERQDSPMVTPLRRSRSRTPELSPRALPPIAEQPAQEEGSPALAPAPAALALTRRLRSRSRTPERIDKSVKESPRLEAIKELPVSIESPPASPTRRGLRSRSRTPEVEVPEQPVVTSPRSLRSRSKTPEKLMSPKKESSRNKKSLSRIVLEANAFAKTKQIEKMDTESIEEKTDSTVESTPVKSSKDTPSFMDVTFSPIVNKSILQSSTESFLSMTTKEISKSDEDSGIKPLPAFTTINEVYMEKSVLHSYESSVAESSIEEREMKTELKSLPAFTTMHEDFGKSVLHSVESSIETSVQEKEGTKVEELPKISFKLNESDFGKPVLGNESTIDSSKAKSVDSSIMTSDSEVETNWKSQETARVMKEKEKIVEIEREINEIEGEMSDECRVESDSEVVEESSESAEEESDESEEEEESTSESENEIISINDSDESSDANNLQIDEQMPIEEKVTEVVEEVKIQEIEASIIEEEIIVENPIEITEEKKEVEPTSVVEDPAELNQVPNMSILTDDNSIVESESVNLNYSDENKEEIDNKNSSEAMETDPVEVVVIVEAMQPITEEKEDIPVVEKVEAEQTSLLKSLDVVDASLPLEPKLKDSQVEKAEDKKIEPTLELASEMTSIIVAKEEIKIPTKEMVVGEASVLPEKEISKEENVHQNKDEYKEKEVPKEETKEIVKEKSKDKEEMKTQDNVEQIVDKPMQSEEMIAKETPLIRKRTKSTSSTKSIDTEVQKTPSTRRRAQSVNKETIEEKTPDSKTIEVSTPRRAKTPSDVRKIITRRASREISEKLEEDSITEELTPRRRSTRSRSKKEDDNVSVASESSVKSKSIATRRASKETKEAEKVEDIKGDVLTPRRRSTRSRSKKEDDNASVVSDSSVKSNRSRMSEEGEIKVRKGRKSILSTKPDLSVIPEVATEESKAENDDIMQELSARRLTRNQKAVLESWLEPKSPHTPGRRASVASRSEADDDDASSTHSMDPQTMDRINLLNKPDFEGATPESYESPLRGRRASFARACEALHTPKGRRTSTDQRKADLSSQQGSPSEGSPSAPGRRPRRASTASNTSQTKADTAKKSKKTADRDKESKE